VEGKALGFPIRLAAADLSAIGEFAARIGVLDHEVRKTP
jgi:hypothetical protein